MKPPADPPGAAPAASVKGSRPLCAADVWGMLAGLLLLLLAWRIVSVLLLAFAGILLALVLLQLSRPLQRRLKLPPALSLVLVVLGLVLLVAGGSWLAGASAAEQLQQLRETLPRALQALRGWLESFAPGRWLLDTVALGQMQPDDWQKVAGIATGTLNASIGVIGSLVLVVAVGVYLAADPDTYHGGLLRLLPPAAQARARRALDASGQALSKWLLGQGVSMLAVGLLTAAGLMLIGMPLALTLGAIAAVLDFVPYFGPIVSGVLIVAVALTEGETSALWALGVCVAVQQIEAYVVQPLAQRWAVRLPPVLGMLSVLIFGLLFGLPGVLLAVPLMVLTMTLVEHLYVQPMRQRRAERE